ncbi:hypothetical protein DFH11DRAFT_1551127 [Phellopilus nigrolimitatus]|nr:hypothetical protein DFH11DRAFT_1551127 [Phellopilus nigrolimitatus]
MTRRSQCDLASPRRTADEASSGDGMRQRSGCRSTKDVARQEEGRAIVEAREGPREYRSEASSADEVDPVGGTRQSSEPCEHDGCGSFVRSRIADPASAMGARVVQGSEPCECGGTPAVACMRMGPSCRTHARPSHRTQSHARKTRPSHARKTVQLAHARETVQLAHARETQPLHAREAAQPLHACEWGPRGARAARARHACAKNSGEGERAGEEGGESVESGCTNRGSCCTWFWKG